MDTRFIARLDLKGPNLIKGVHLEGLRVLGNPQEYAQKYYQEGIEELIFIDIVASLYGRSKLVDIIKDAASNIFVPLTVGGGVRTLNDVDDLLRSGADKIAINTFAVNNPSFIEEVAKRFGSQCMVASIEAKSISNQKWEVYTESGRETTGLDVIDWVKTCVDLGAGEILLTSIDREGTRRGFETDLISSVTNSINIPVIASGGYGHTRDIPEAINAGASAIAIADALHYERVTVKELKEGYNSYKDSQF